MAPSANSTGRVSGGGVRSSKASVRPGTDTMGWSGLPRLSTETTASQCSTPGIMPDKAQEKVSAAALRTGTPDSSRWIGNPSLQQAS